VQSNLRQIQKRHEDKSIAASLKEALSLDERVGDALTRRVYLGLRHHEPMQDEWFDANAKSLKFQLGQKRGRDSTPSLDHESNLWMKRHKPNQEVQGGPKMWKGSFQDMRLRSSVARNPLMRT